MNEFGQAIGTEVPGWNGVDLPPREPMEGRSCRVEPLDSKTHLDDLYDAFSDDREGILWTYMVVGPFNSKDDFRAWLEQVCTTDDPSFHAVVDLSTDKAVGMAAYMRIQPSAGVIEVGSITYSPRLQNRITESLLAAVLGRYGHQFSISINNCFEARTGIFPPGRL